MRKEIRWIRSWIKLNMDGAAKGNPAIAGCGGLLRDETARWIDSFAKFIGVCTAVHAELWGGLFWSTTIA